MSRDLRAEGKSAKVTERKCQRGGRRLGSVGYCIQEGRKCTLAVSDGPVTGVVHTMTAENDFS